MWFLIPAAIVVVPLFFRELAKIRDYERQKGFEEDLSKVSSAIGCSRFNRSCDEALQIK